MNLALFGHTWRANRARALIVAVALAIWGTFMPIIFDSFGSTFADIFESGAFPPQFTQFGGGDIFSLTGSVAIGFIHPIAVGLNLVFAVGFAAAAVAGERQRGTLEVLLSRPHSRSGACSCRWSTRRSSIPRWVPSSSRWSSRAPSQSS